MKDKLKKYLLPNLPYLFFVYLFDKLCQAVRLAPGLDTSEKLLHIGQGFQTAFASSAPSFHALDICVGILGAVLVRLAVYVKGKNAKKYRKGIEYGSARWGTAADIAPYVDPVPDWNIPLTRAESLTMTSRPKQPKYARNKNILVIGGSGSGKTRFFVKPNLMQMHSSYVVTDPKGTVLVECGKMLSKNNYRIKVLNTINFAKSMHYNPFAYIRSEKDILKLVNTIIVNTKGEGQQASEDFWVKAEKLYYTALIAYIWYEAPEEEQNFSMLIDLVDASEAREDDENFKNAVDLLGVLGFCHNFYRPGLFHLIDDGVKQDAVAFGFHLKALQVLLLDGKDRQLLAVVDQALEVGEVVIGREVILIAEQVVGHTVVPRIDHDEDIIAADGFLDQTLGVTALEAGALAGDDEALFFHTGRLGPLDKMLVDEGGQLFRTGAGQQTQICNTGLLKKCHRINFVGHIYTPSCSCTKPNDQTT